MKEFETCEKLDNLLNSGNFLFSSFWVGVQGLSKGLMTVKLKLNLGVSVIMP